MGSANMSAMSGNFMSGEVGKTFRGIIVTFWHI
jgi:hypothetical protein